MCMVIQDPSSTHDAALRILVHLTCVGVMWMQTYAEAWDHALQVLSTGGGVMSLRMVANNARHKTLRTLMTVER